MNKRKMKTAYENGVWVLKMCFNVFFIGIGLILLWPLIFFVLIPAVIVVLFCETHEYILRKLS